MTSPTPEPKPGPDPELVLSQALRAMAGGQRPDPTRARRGATSKVRLSTAQLLLFATLLGLIVGIAAGLISLLV